MTDAAAGQFGLFDAARPRPAFDGVTFDPRLDETRLGRQFAKVFEFMASGEWHTPAEIEAATGANWASAGARLRDARKARWGGHEVQRRRREPAEAGVWEYRLIVNGTNEGSAVNG